MITIFRKVLGPKGALCAFYWPVLSIWEPMGARGANNPLVSALNSASLTNCTQIRRSMYANILVSALIQTG